MKTYRLVVELCGPRHAMEQMHIVGPHSNEMVFRTETVVIEARSSGHVQDIMDDVVRKMDGVSYRFVELDEFFRP